MTITDYKASKPIAWYVPSPAWLILLIATALSRNMRLNGDNYTIKDTILDAETTGGFPFNTDGFDVA